MIDSHKDHFLLKYKYSINNFKSYLFKSNEKLFKQMYKPIRSV